MELEFSSKLTGMSQNYYYTRCCIIRTDNIYAFCETNKQKLKKEKKTVW